MGGHPSSIDFDDFDDFDEFDGRDMSMPAICADPVMPYMMADAPRRSRSPINSVWVTWQGGVCGNS